MVRVDRDDVSKAEQVLPAFDVAVPVLDDCTGVSSAAQEGERAGSGRTRD